MRLELGYEDLKPEHTGCNPSQTRFDKFTDKVQQAIQIVGEAVFYNGDRSNYNKIYPMPKKNATKLKLIHLINGEVITSNLIMGLRTKSKCKIAEFEHPPRVMLHIAGGQDVSIMCVGLEEANNEAKRIAALL